MQSLAGMGLLAPLLHMKADSWGLMQDGPRGQFLSQFSRKLGFFLSMDELWEPLHPWNHIQNALGKYVSLCMPGEGLCLYLMLREGHAQPGTTMRRNESPEKDQGCAAN